METNVFVLPGIEELKIVRFGKKRKKITVSKSIGE